jgi:DNA-binding beta-propeller fold protein YncE
MIVGSGKFRYEVVVDWAQLPKGWQHGDVTSVVTDRQDRVYVFTRSAHPVIVYDRDGRFLDSWGEGILRHGHGISITHDDFLYCTDDWDHTVRKFTTDGKLLQTLGTPGRPSDTGYDSAGPTSLMTIKRGAGPFNRPTQVAEAPNGDLYVSDGYGNARIHRFTADGKLVQSWGEPGDRPGEFNLPHSVWVHTDGRVFVCDRENDRVQIFDSTGQYLGVWTNVSRPDELYIDGQDHVYVAQLELQEGRLTMAGRPVTRPSLPQVSIRDLEGNLLTRWGGPDPLAPDSFVSPHGICVDSHGDIYVGEVVETDPGRLGRYRPDYPALKKFVRF